MSAISARAVVRASVMLTLTSTFGSGDARAQACLGTPLKEKAFAIEAHYSRVWVFRGVGASVTRHLPSGIYARAGYMHTYGAHGGSLRGAWEMPGRSYSACPTIGLTYNHQERGHSLSIPLGFAVSASGPDDAHRRVLVYAFPQLIHTRYTFDEPAIERGVTAFATEFGMRIMGASSHAGATFGFVSEDGHREALLGVTAGLRTGHSSTDSASVARTDVRDRFGFNAGVIWVDTGDDPITQCGAGPGFTLGTEVRTRGAWLVAAGVDLMANLAAVCTSALYMREFNGQMVSVHNTPFIVGPRLRLSVGHAFTAGTMIIEPAAAAGVISMYTDEPADDRFTSKWYGGIVTLRTRDGGKALHFEYGWRELPFSYYDGQIRVHAYSELEPMARLVFEF